MIKIVYAFLANQTSKNKNEVMKDLWKKIIKNAKAILFNQNRQILS